MSFLHYPISEELSDMLTESARGKYYFKWMIFKIEKGPNGGISIQEKLINPLDQDAAIESFNAAFPRDECRYGLFNFSYERDGGRRSKQVFILWAPSDAPTKSKVIYTSAKSNFKERLGSLCGVTFELQIGHSMDAETFLERIDRI